MLQSCIPYLNKHLNIPVYNDYHDHEFFFFLGDHVTNECGFCTGDDLITIPYLPKSDLCGFIYFVIFSRVFFGYSRSVLSVKMAYRSVGTRRRYISQNYFQIKCYFGIMTSNNLTE